MCYLLHNGVTDLLLSALYYILWLNLKNELPSVKGADNNTHFCVGFWKIEYSHNECIYLPCSTKWTGAMCSVRTALTSGTLEKKIKQWNIDELCCRSIQDAWKWKIYKMRCTEIFCGQEFTMKERQTHYSLILISLCTVM